MFTITLRGQGAVSEAKLVKFHQDATKSITTPSPALCLIRSLFFSLWQTARQRVAQFFHLRIICL